MLSGRKDPKWTVDSNHPKFEETQPLLKDARMQNVTHSPEQMPAQLGYEDLLVISEKNVELIVVNDTVRLQQALLGSIPEDVLPHKKRHNGFGRNQCWKCQGWCTILKSLLCSYSILKVGSKSNWTLPLPSFLILPVFQEIESSCTLEKVTTETWNIGENVHRVNDMITWKAIWWSPGQSCLKQS